MNRIIWQPESLYQPGPDFRIIVDREFVAEMLKTPLSGEIQDRMNSLGADLTNQRGSSWATPYVFEPGKALVRQFNLGKNGGWLALDDCSGGNPLEHFREPNPIIYTSHNVRSTNQAHLLLSLVDLWTSYADIMKGD